MGFPNSKFKPGSKPRTAAVMNLSLPDIVQLEPAETRPSVLLQGGSGAGKTHAIGKAIERGFNVLVIAIEPKMQTIQKHRPHVLFVGQRLPNGDKPTATQVYTRLQEFVERLGKGEYREVGGKPVDIIAIDGFMELGTVIYNHFKGKGIRAASTGNTNSYALWDGVAEAATDFFHACRDAAGLAAVHDGVAPVSIVATIGERPVSEKFGSIRYEPIFPGKKAPTNLPFAFDVVLRLAARTGEEGHEYVAHTTKTEEFDAKTPPGLFEPEVINPDFGEMYQRLLDHYADTTKPNGDSD